MLRGMHSLFIAGMFLLFCINAKAAGPFHGKQVALSELSKVQIDTSAEAHHEPTRLVAAALAVTLGPFGAHRLYLGTNAKVPLFYGLTFGGFGVLVLIDLGHIIFTKDLTPYEHNTQVLMWAEKETTSGTTPP